jgi:hypothetical protein
LNLESWTLILIETDSEFETRDHAIWLNVSKLLLTAFENINIWKISKLSASGRIDHLFSSLSMILIVGISTYGK